MASPHNLKGLFEWHYYYWLCSFCLLFFSSEFSLVKTSKVRCSSLPWHDSAFAPAFCGSGTWFLWFRFSVDHGEVCFTHSHMSAPQAASFPALSSPPAILFVRPPVNVAAGLALSFLCCFYWFQPDRETDRKKGPFQEEVKWSSSELRVAFTTLLTRWKNVTIMEALAADSELIGWVPRGQSGARLACSQTRANKRAEESAWTGREVCLHQATLWATFHPV